MDYHEHTVSIGFSDIASVTVRTPSNDDDSFIINFGGDGDYRMHIIIDDECEIPSHYQQIKSVDTSWIWIYDDQQRTFNSGDVTRNAKRFTFYRAGDYGLILQIETE